MPHLLSFGRGLPHLLPKATCATGRHRLLPPAWVEFSESYVLLTHSPHINCVPTLGNVRIGVHTALPIPRSPEMRTLSSSLASHSPHSTQGLASPFPVCTGAGAPAQSGNLLPYKGGTQWGTRESSPGGGRAEPCSEQSPEAAREEAPWIWG